MQGMAVWRGNGNERGHWRLVCGAGNCTRVLGFVDPVELGEDDPALVWIACPQGLEYHPDRDKVCRIVAPQRFGPDGVPMPARGGRKQHAAPFGARRYYWFDRLGDEVRASDASPDEKARRYGQARREKAAQLERYPHLIYSQRAVGLGARVMCPACRSVNRLDLPADRVAIACEGWLLVLRTNDPLAVAILRHCPEYQL